MTRVEELNKKYTEISEEFETSLNELSEIENSVEDLYPIFLDTLLIYLKDISLTLGRLCDEIGNRNLVGDED